MSRPRSAYRSPRNAKRFRVLGTPPPTFSDHDPVFVCEGLRRPSKGAHWRLVAVVDRKTLGAHRAESEARKALYDLEGTAAHGMDKEARAAARAAIPAAREALEAARADLEAWLSCYGDEALGVAIIPADSPELDFV